MSVNETRTREQLEAFITKALQNAPYDQLKAVAGYLEVVGYVERTQSVKVPKRLVMPDEHALERELNERSLASNSTTPFDEAHRRAAARLAR